MKKIIIGIGLIFSFVFVLFAFQDEKQIEVRSEILTKDFLEKRVPIIDIRTSSEWRKTGVVEGSHLITFYNEDRTFDESKFMQELKHVVRKGDNFAILCRSGNRSDRVTRFLISKGFPNVINLSGGINMAKANGIELTFSKM